MRRLRAGWGASLLPLGTLLGLVLLVMPATDASAEVETDILGSAPGRFNSIVAEDVDDDGRVELVTGNYEGYLNIMEYRDGNFELEWRSSQWGHRLWGVEFLDVDGDGDREIVAGDGDGTVRLVDGRTHRVTEFLEEVGRDAHGLQVANLDGDPEPELFVGTGYKLAGALGGKRWICELAYPYKGFNTDSTDKADYRYSGPPRRGEVWGLRVMRFGPKFGREVDRMGTSWTYNPTPTTNHIPFPTGIIVFEHRNALLNGNLNEVDD